MVGCRACVRSQESSSKHGGMDSRVGAREFMPSFLGRTFDCVRNRDARHTGQLWWDVDLCTVFVYSIVRLKKVFQVCRALSGTIAVRRMRCSRPERLLLPRNAGQGHPSCCVRVCRGWGEWVQAEVGSHGRTRVKRKSRNAKSPPLPSTLSSRLGSGTTPT